MAEQYSKPGEPVEQSGIYRVTHHDHRSQHDVSLFAGDRFPPCAQCGNHVRFAMLQAAGEIGDDRDFKARKTPARRKSAGTH